MDGNLSEIDTYPEFAALSVGSDETLIPKTECKI
jgi:hypothetical protein